MNKSEFTKLLANNMHTSVASANKTLRIVFSTIIQSIITEDTLMFVGFGTFKTSISKSKNVKTPRGTIVHVPKKRTIRFSPGSTLKEKANTKKIK